MTKSRKPKLLMIALDAGELRLVEQLVQEGKLPNIGRLREKSALARVKSVTEWFVAGPWPSFYTGTHPAEHGIYHYLPWNPHEMASQPPAADEFSREPFWRDFQLQGLNTLIIDAPMVHPPPRSGSGVEICGWCTHDYLSEPWVNPVSVRERLDASGLARVNLTETQRPMDADMLGRLTDTINESTRSIRELALNLLDSQPWDFALVSFTATHIGGHQLWRDTSLDPDIGEKLSELRTAAFESIYVNCDLAVGSLVEAVPDGTMIVLASLHGIEANTSQGELLPDMLQLILSGQDNHRTDEGSVFRLLRVMRESLPRDWRHTVKKRLPRSLQHWLTGLWRTGGKDWSRTKAFALIPDLQGYIRINLQGREAKGLVKPGKEYDALCDQIITGLTQFVDADTGIPVVAEAKRMNEICSGFPDLNHLPDIAIKWSEKPCSAHREITSPYGSIPWPTPGLDFDGRSGNHRPYGFFWASGSCIQPRTNLPDVDIKDLAPTLYDIFSVSKPAHMHGQSFLGRMSLDNQDSS